MNDDEAMKNMFEIERLLHKFWTDGWMSSYTVNEIMDMFPPRLKEIMVVQKG